MFIQVFMKEAQDSNVQIIVFPEYGLYGPIFTTRYDVLPFLENIPDVGTNPCLDWKDSSQKYEFPITYRASCMARKYGMVLVLDMGDKVMCTNQSESNKCPDSGFFQYNTQVAYDEQGKLLGKYHKRHLYYEPEFDYGQGKPQNFTTSFGVNFGMFICFDIVFRDPPISLVMEGISDFVFSSWWVNTPPLLTATIMQQSWSLVFGRNILASNSGHSWSSSGSGIYHNGKALNFYYNNDPTSEHSKLLIADVEKITSTGTSNHDHFINPSDNQHHHHHPVNPHEDIVSNDPHLINPNFKKLDTTGGNKGSLELSLPSVTCWLNYSISPKSNSNQSYYFFVFSGPFGLINATFCALVMCAHDNMPECLFSSSGGMQGDIIFGLHTVISAKFYEKDLVIFPVTTIEQAKLYDSWNYHVESDESHVLKISSDERLLQFGFFGRNIGETSSSSSLP
eukprot:TRINITY_DN6538_c0_g2_i2.p1 TRINITY_DN6538_c0_g2~~TRINITY_DN6538_c0_g2_i2.p1  ORF type:complete len:451 (-),score=74.37 TRINITY_DN6538_c0_g2_i2:82-1434(-)